jgi:squalene cyclase
VDVILSLQNPAGGFASYELVRGPGWLEHLSPGEVFGKTMIESVSTPLFTPGYTWTVNWYSETPDLHSFLFFI